MSALSLTHEESLAAAAKQGLAVITPKANELFVDIDSDASFEAFTTMVAKLAEFEPGTQWQCAPSKSGLPKRHAVVTLTREVGDIERIALQAILASDPLRELLSYVRVRAGQEAPIKFFERLAS